MARRKMQFIITSLYLDFINLTENICNYSIKEIYENNNKKMCNSAVNIYNRTTNFVARFFKKYIVAILRSPFILHCMR